jgi:hypothetical protein
MIINKLFSIFIFDQKEVVDGWTGYAALVDEQLNERVGIQPMEVIEVIPIYEFADGRAAFMLYSDFRAVYGLEINTLMIKLFKANEARMNFFQLVLIHRAKLFNMIIYYPLEVDRIWR